MAIQELLKDFIDNNKDVTFPIHHADSSHVADTSRYYGFSTDGASFQTHWSLEFNNPVRITAAFTGVIYMRSDYPGHPVILLKIFSTPPLTRINGLPGWYPLPKVAKYEPFTEVAFRRVIEDLLTVDLPRITELVGPDPDEVTNRFQENIRRLATVTEHYISANGLPADTTISTTELVDLFIRARLASGIPVSAGTVLFRSSGSLNFWLYPIDGYNAPVETLFFNPGFYFGKWRRRIEDYNDFPSSFTSGPLGPPLSTGNILYIKQTAAPGFSPLYSNVAAAISSANENDTLLILDKGIYEIDRIEKFVSVLALLAPGEEADVKVHDVHPYFRNTPEHYDGSALSTALTANYPIIRNSNEGRRCIHIQYRQGYPASNGIIYLANLAIVGNTIDVDRERTRTNIGGAGILIDGGYYRDNDAIEPLGKDFSQVHIHNCAIVHNRMDGFPLTVPDDEIKPGVGYCGGGILCYYSSPLISNCLIKGNTAYGQGGGIGIFKYGWPTINNNVISSNTTGGHPFRDWDGGTEPGGNGDGGGIGVFQAYPIRRDAVSELILALDLAAGLPGAFRAHLLEAWENDKLRNAKQNYIHIHNNIIHDNKAEMSGGGVYGSVLALISMHNNQIYGNRAVKQDGGGIAVTFGSELQLNGTSDTLNRIENNTAGRRGGGVFIRSSKAVLRNVHISGNDFLTSSGVTGEGGGIAVLSIPEILSPLFVPEYDIILHLIFDNIDIVELILENAVITANTAGTGAGLYAYKNSSEYYLPPRQLGASRGILGPLDIHLHVETESDVQLNNPDDFYVYEFPLGTVSLEYANPPANTIIDLTF